MAPPRFLLERFPVPGGIAWLPREEARQAVGSRRLGAGDSIELVDGLRRVARARVGSERDRDGKLATEVLEVERRPRPAPAIHVGTAVPKGDRLSTLLDPMFPAKRKPDAKPPTAMQALAAVVGADQDADALLLPALGVASQRVVVKRPRQALPLAGLKPAWTIEGKLLRFDVYRGQAKA